MPNILVIDDDVELSDLLKELLSLEGYTVFTAYNGVEGILEMNDTIDLVLLDIMMPKLNGIETLKKLREAWDAPVIMLTAKGNEIDRVIGLELGADDYLPKPFSERELLARVRAVLRRSSGSSGTEKIVSSDLLQCGDIKIYPSKLEAYCNGILLDLTSTEFGILSHFLLHAGQVLSKESLSMDVLGKHLTSFDRSIDMHVSNLRKKLPEWKSGKPRIKTLRGRGYLLVAEE